MTPTEPGSFNPAELTQQDIERLAVLSVALRKHFDRLEGNNQPRLIKLANKPHAYALRPTIHQRGLDTRVTQEKPQLVKATRLCLNGVPLLAACERVSAPIKFGRHSVTQPVASNEDWIAFANDVPALVALAVDRAHRHHQETFSALYAACAAASVPFRTTKKSSKSSRALIERMKTVAAKSAMPPHTYEVDAAEMAINSLENLVEAATFAVDPAHLRQQLFVVVHSQLERLATMLPVGFSVQLASRRYIALPRVANGRTLCPMDHVPLGEKQLAALERKSAYGHVSLSEVLDDKVWSAGERVVRLDPIELAHDIPELIQIVAACVPGVVPVSESGASLSPGLGLSLGK